MSHEFYERNGITFFVLDGQLTAQNLGDVSDLLSRKVDGGKYRFVFDLSRTTWMGSMALGLLATSIRVALMHNTRVRIVNPNPKIVSLLRDTSLLDLCHVLSTVEMAERSFV